MEFSAMLLYISDMRFILLLMLTLPFFLPAQEQFKSSHQQQWEFYRDHPELAVPSVVPPMAKRDDLMKVQSMNKVVYGFHPYWQNGVESNYYFSLLTHLAYFSADVDTATGGFSSTHSWSSAAVVTMAKSYGVKVHFSVTLFGSHSAILSSTTKKNALINNIMTQINLRNADGCNIDFEAVGSSQATAFRTFLKQLGDTLKAHNKEFVVELYAVDWNGIFPAAFFSMLDPVVDYYFIMLYDYWYSGSPTAGPSAPLMATNSTSYYHVLRSIKTYLAVGCPADKIIAGFPSYGNDWPVVSSARMAATTASSSSRTYTVVKNNYIDTISASNQFIDATFSVPWYRYISGGVWRQVWYDDSLSWARKFDSINVKNVAGTGMWALGYDGAEPEMWGALKTAFASTPNPSHTSFDDFETNVGRFDKYPRWSGSTTGIDITSSQGWTNDEANNGQGSLVVTLKDSSETAVNWSVRLNSGGSSRVNNEQFSKTGYIGFWLKTSSAPSGAQVAVTIDDQRNGGTDKTELSSRLTVTNDGAWHLYEWNLAGTGWSSFSGGNGVLDSAILSLDAIMSYAPNASPDWTFTIDDVSFNSSSPLPVELVSFTAVSAIGNTELKWTTATERDNYGFEIERSAIDNGEWRMENWEKRGFIQGSGTSNSPQSYRFTDALSGGSSYRFRLRQIDRNGAYKYSQELLVNNVEGVPARFMMEQNYPNPFNPATTLSFTLQTSGMTTLIIYDALGREVAVLANEQLEAGVLHQRTFNASHLALQNAGGLASGVYFARLVSSGNYQVRKMLMMK